MGACRADERLNPLLKLNNATGAAEDRLLAHLSQYAVTKDFSTYLRRRKPTTGENQPQKGKKKMRTQLLTLFDQEKQEQHRRNLHEAAMNGSLPSLPQTLDQTPPILASSPPPSPSSSTDTPLHVAALLGHLDFAKSLLTRNPDLAGKLNSDGSTPLHLASAKGYAEIVRELVSVNPDVGFVLDRDGRSPFHLACIKGRVGVLTELLRVNPELAWAVTGGGGESCLHLCVKYNRLEALKVVVEGFGKDEFVNWKDGDGNTVLHLAVAKKQLEIIKFLLVTTAIESVMAYNIPIAYRQFMIFDTIAFLASLSIILLQVSGLPIKRRRWMWVQMVTMWIAITAQTITYFITLIHMTPKNVQKTLYEVTKISVLTWLSLIAIVFIGNFVRVIMWLLRKYGYIKEEEDPNNGDDDENDDL
ncbi:hypothetical protein RHGRI_021402 [Rhododendron griersonianum]|uniref:PGG domain-containing protein n=1 Tax=Rhododendron griersonianum TaxID=479676 RepID=A0AAV6JQW8_9ERIC|nr:hypothetical protein RHGRI_021402 [Rhododendron griersonianum]